jgi:DNA-binding transcriptional LysR family regulator
MSRGSWSRPITAASFACAATSLAHITINGRLLRLRPSRYEIKLFIVILRISKTLMRGLNLDQLQAFALVVELGTFSGAAERLNFTQPAISQQLRKLERHLGVRLVERLGRRARPTAAGRDLLAHIRSIDKAVADALGAMAAHSGGDRGRLRLGTGATACTYLLPPILRDLRMRMPLLEIVVSTGNTPDMLRSVDDNILDAALVTLPAPGRMFQVTRIYEDELVAVFPVSERPIGTNVINARALINRPLVFYEAEGHTRRVIDDWFMRSGFAAKPIMELGSVEAIKELVAVGLGWSVLPRLCMTGTGKRPELATRSLSPRLRRSLGIVMRRDKKLDRGLRELTRALAVRSTTHR